MASPKKKWLRRRAAELAAQGSNGGGHQDYLLMFHNSTTDNIEVYADADSSAVGGGVLIASLTGTDAEIDAILAGFDGDNISVA